MKLRNYLPVTAALVYGFWVAAPARADGFWRSCPAQGREDTWRFGSTFIPGVSWDAWRVLLANSWTRDQRTQPGWFGISELTAAAKIAASGATEGLDAGLDDADPAILAWAVTPEAPFVPSSSASDEDTQNYRNAGDLIKQKQWQAALQALDGIAASQSSYRAAAAYTAARLVLDSGDTALGIQRIGSILGDPMDREMNQAAHHLLGTVAYETGNASLLGARLSEISHLLVAPPEIRCRSQELGQLSTEADQDIAHIVTFAFPTNEMRAGDYSPRRRKVFEAVSRLDPVIDLVRVLSEPTPYEDQRAWTEPFFPQAVALPGFQLDDQPTVRAYVGEREAAIRYARKKVVDTGSPLWAFALARLTSEPSDIPALASAVSALGSGLDLQDDRAMLAAWLVAHQARILLMSGRSDEAMRLMASSASVIRNVGRDPHVMPRTDPGQFLARGGEVYLLARRDPAQARRWKEEAESLLPYGYDSEDDGLDVLLAPDWKAAIAAGYKHAKTIPLPMAATLDLLSSDRLLELSRTPGLPQAWKRPMLGAAWIRYYALNRDEDFEALYPEVRAAFPETVPDLDDIEHAWLPSTRRHRIARMLLRLPGLSPRVLWNRENSPRDFYGQGRPDIFAVDQDDPDDGNWWCPLDPARARRDAFLQANDRLSDDWGADAQMFASGGLSGALPKGEPSIDALASEWTRKNALARQGDDAELQALSRIQSGPRRLTDEAVSWARSSNVLTRWLGMDRDLAETLALAVRSTRYGCRIAGPLGPSSHAAWTALHARFPTSEWARRTPFWFDETVPPPHVTDTSPFPK